MKEREFEGKAAESLKSETLSYPLIRYNYGFRLGLRGPASLKTGPLMPVMQIRTVIPLWHFKLGADTPLGLDSHLSIRRLSSSEAGIVEEHLGTYGVIHPEYAIEFRREEERPEFPSESLGRRYAAALDDWLSKVDIDAGFNYAKKVNEAMRLFASGDVGTQFFMNLFPAGGSETGNPDELSSHYVDDQYTIGQENAAAFAAFWRKYSDWNPGNLSRHLERFLRAYRQDDWYDRLIDFVTSVEGLVLPGVTQEVRYQFSLRIALLLGSSRSEREGRRR